MGPPLSAACRTTCATAPTAAALSGTAVRHRRRVDFASRLRHPVFVASRGRRVGTAERVVEDSGNASFGAIATALGDTIGERE
jgi:hypothetical protein